ncbi:flagellar hook-basal body complex protein [Desulfurella multipotens]|uniref:flagellar hook-basal body complex protein n=1 Tax=Desulfurella multipotens TaxID=79269 RepID=UPI000CAB2D4F|nr:flagellar hook-basal body complex protein [Desulfurella multipotens]PMP67836.1 MAG: hypothetical protein C0192_02890 [Desulfurella multipotens]
MMRSLWSGVSGLQANQEFMDVVGNNIANVNTVGFKASLINFSDVLSQTLSGASAPQGNLGGMNPKQIGLGTQIANINKNFSQGSLQTTNITTNLAIQGNGFFIVSGDGGNTYEYTRAGNFNFDANGNLVDPLGNIVQGWMANNTTHTINTASSIKSINIPQNMTVPAGVTKNISIAGNLNGGDTITEMSPAIGTDNMNVLFNSNGNAIGIGQTTQTAQLDTSGSNDLGATSTAPDYNINGQPIALASGATVSMSINGTTNTFTYGTDFTTLDGLANAISNKFGVSASVSNGELVIKNTGTNPITISNIATTGDTGGVLAGILQNLQNGPGNSATIPAGGSRTSLPVFSKPGDAVALSYDGGANYNTYIYNYSSSNAGNGNGSDFSTLAGLVANINKDLTNSPWGSNSTASINQDGQIVITNNSGSSQTIGAVYSNNITLGTILGTLSGTTAPSAICASQPFEADIHNTSIDVYDSLGNKHTLTFNFRKVSYDPTTQQSTWVWTASAPAPANILNSSGTLKFNSNGQLTYESSPLAITVNWNNGTASQVINLNYGSIGTFNGLTQFSLPSQTTSQTQDGFPSGSLQSILVNQDGVIEGLFSNGKSYPLAQIALATFNNDNGLMSKGGSLFAATANSGTPVISTAGTQGAGTIAPSTLEESNVDLGTEFTNMIIAERAYQANTRIISTSDQMLQTLLNIQ